MMVTVERGLHAVDAGLAYPAQAHDDGYDRGGDGRGGPQHTTDALFGVGIALFVITFLINLAGRARHLPEAAAGRFALMAGRSLVFQTATFRPVNANTAWRYGDSADRVWAGAGLLVVVVPILFVVAGYRRARSVR